MDRTIRIRCGLLNRANAGAADGRGHRSRLHTSNSPPRTRHRPLHHARPDDPQAAQLEDECRRNLHQRPPDPIRGSPKPRNGKMPDFQGVPSVGAGLRARSRRFLPGESATATATLDRCLPVGWLRPAEPGSAPPA
jgi:hypothetical protein